MYSVVRYSATRDYADVMHPAAAQTAKGAFTAAIEQEEPSRLIESENGVTFSGGLLRLASINNWNLLLPISDGEFTATMTPKGLRVTCTLTFYEILLVAFCFAGMMSTAVYFASDTRSFTEALLVFAFFFVCAGPVNSAIAVLRFTGLIHRCVNEARDT